MDATTDLTKSKVADLKKELKIRGLATTGKRTELLDRLQAALAAGVGLEDGAEDDEEFDEDEILAGDDADDDDSKMTPLEEAAALAAAEKPTAAAAATPGRGRRSLAAAPGTPRTAQKKLALRRTTGAALVVPEEPAAPTPAKAVTPAKPSPKKTPAKTPTPADDTSADEPPVKAIKLVEGTTASGKENGDATKKTEMELRADRFGVVSDKALKDKRSERFGGSNTGNKLSMEIGSIDVDKLKSRAARFGETTAKTLTTAEHDEKRKTRMERFGNGTADKKDVSSDDALAARAAKFAPAVPDKAEAKSVEPVISASGKKLITMSAGDAALQKRSARFAAV